MIPRRIQLDRLTPAERAIRDAMLVVERTGAHLLLTEAVILLSQAQEKVADFVDQHANAEPSSPGPDEMAAGRTRGNDVPPARFFGWGDWRELSNVEPGIRPICEEANRSGWLWTAESCEGHGPDNPSFGGWRFAGQPHGNERPMLRFVCRTEHVGRLLNVLSLAQRDAALCCVTIYPGSNQSDAEWSDVLTYIDGEASLDAKRGVYATVARLASDERGLPADRTVLLAAAREAASAFGEVGQLRHRAADMERGDDPRAVEDVRRLLDYFAGVRARLDHVLRGVPDRERHA